MVLPPLARANEPGANGLPGGNLPRFRPCIAGKIRIWLAVLLVCRPGGPGLELATGWWSRFCAGHPGPFSGCGTAGMPPWSTRRPGTTPLPAGNPHQRAGCGSQANVVTASKRLERQLQELAQVAAGPPDRVPRWSWPPEQDWA